MIKGSKRMACILSFVILLASVQMPVLAEPEANNDVIIEDSAGNTTDSNEIINYEFEETVSEDDSDDGDQFW